MKIYVSPHDLASEGAKLLSEKLEATRINPSAESKYKYKPNEQHFVINWGRSTRPSWFVENMRILNDPIHVAKAVNKTTALKLMKDAGVSVPEFSTNIEDAKHWIDAGNIVFCRTLTRSSGGEGIVVANTKAELVAAPLFTQYKKKKYEFRVAIVNGIVIDFMQKKKRTDWNVEINGEIDSLIRSHARGWIFARENVTLPAGVKDQAIKAIKAIGLNFGSVDIIFNETENKAYTLEVNTSPGLEEGGTSLERYSKALKSLINNQQIQEITANIAAPVAPAQVAPAPPVPQAVAPAPVIQNNNAAAGAKEYSLQGVQNLKIKKVGNVIKITGNVNGIGNRIKIMEINGGEINGWFQDVD